MIEYEFIKEEAYYIQAPYDLTEKGELAANIQELHCLVFADILDDKMFDNFNAKELVCILSCFTTVSVPREQRKPNANGQNIPENAKKIIHYIEEKYYEYDKIMRDNYLENYRGDELHFELCELMYEWCDIQDEAGCNLFYKKLQDKNIFLGEFIKAALKINNIANEFETACTIQSNMKLLELIKEIPFLTLKNIATNQSLYL